MLNDALDIIEGDMKNRSGELTEGKKRSLSRIKEYGNYAVAKSTKAPKAPQYKDGDKKVLNGKTWTRINGEWK